MPKDTCIPVYLCALSTHCLYGSCEEVSSVIGVLCLSQHFVFAL